MSTNMDNNQNEKPGKWSEDTIETNLNPKLINEIINQIGNLQVQITLIIITIIIIQVVYY